MNNAVPFNSSSSAQVAQALQQQVRSAQEVLVTATTTSRQRLLQRAHPQHAALGAASGTLTSLGMQLQYSAAEQQYSLVSDSAPHPSSSLHSVNHSNQLTAASAAPQVSLEHGWQQAAAAANVSGVSWRHLQPLGQQSLQLGQNEQQQQQQHAQEQLQQLPLHLQQQLSSWWQQHADVMGPLLKGVLSAPLLAGVVAIMIGSCPPLQVSCEAATLSCPLQLYMSAFCLQIFYRRLHAAKPCQTIATLHLPPNLQLLTQSWLHDDIAHLR
jgi:hypothetical protein